MPTRLRPPQLETNPRSLYETQGESQIPSPAIFEYEIGVPSVSFRAMGAGTATARESSRPCQER